MQETHTAAGRPRLSPNEVRAALVAAIAARPAESWVAFELAETLARAEYKRGAAAAYRRAAGARRAL